LGTSKNLAIYGITSYLLIDYFDEMLERIWMVCSEERPQENQKSTTEYAEPLMNMLKDNKLIFPDLIFVPDIGSKNSIECKLNGIIKNDGNKKIHFFSPVEQKPCPPTRIHILKAK